MQRSRTKLGNIKISKTGEKRTILVITGARQTGKTTLVRQFFKQYPYLSIEDPVMRTQYAQMTAAQWRANFPEAILDEVQKEPALIESIKSVYDQFTDTHYVLLGSSQILLLQKIKESLAGRCVIHEMYPLTLNEIQHGGLDKTPPNSLFQDMLNGKILPDFMPSFLLYSNHAQKQAAFDYYLRYGGYPALTEESMNNESRLEWLSNYVRTYLERDIRDLAEIRNLDPFVRLKKTAALLTGQLTNYSALARESGITNKTAQQFLHYLEISYQTVLLQPWFKNQYKRLSKSPKLHFLDVGIVRSITGNLSGELDGHQFETAIFSEMYKQAKNIGFRGSFYHLHTLDGREIDVLIETEQGFYAFEIKKSQHISTTDARHLLGLQDILDKPLLQAFVLSNDNNIKLLHNNILALPASFFLA